MQSFVSTGVSTDFDVSVLVQGVNGQRYLNQWGFPDLPLECQLQILENISDTATL
jgi:hypothetical protein